MSIIYKNRYISGDVQTKYEQQLETGSIVVGAGAVCREFASPNRLAWNISEQEQTVIDTEDFSDEAVWYIVASFDTNVIDQTVEDNPNTIPSGAAVTDALALKADKDLGNIDSDLTDQEKSDFRDKIGVGAAGTGFDIKVADDYHTPGQQIDVTPDNTGASNTTTVTSVEYVEQGLTTKVDDTQVKQTITNDTNDIASTVALTTEFALKLDKPTGTPTDQGFAGHFISVDSSGNTNPYANDKLHLTSSGAIVVSNDLNVGTGTTRSFNAGTDVHFTKGTVSYLQGDTDVKKVYYDPTNSSGGVSTSDSNEIAVKGDISGLHTNLAAGEVPYSDGTDFQASPITTDGTNATVKGDFNLVDGTTVYVHGDSDEQRLYYDRHNNSGTLDTSLDNEVMVQGGLEVGYTSVDHSAHPDAAEEGILALGYEGRVISELPMNVEETSTSTESFLKKNTNGEIIFSNSNVVQASDNRPVISSAVNTAIDAIEIGSEYGGTYPTTYASEFVLGRGTIWTYNDELWFYTGASFTVDSSGDRDTVEPNSNNQLWEQITGGASDFTFTVVDVIGEIPATPMVKDIMNITVDIVGGGSVEEPQWPAGWYEGVVDGQSTNWAAWTPGGTTSFELPADVPRMGDTVTVNTGSTQTNGGSINADGSLTINVNTGSSGGLDLNPYAVLTAYVAGDYVYHLGEIFRCHTPYTSPNASLEVFGPQNQPEHWAAVTENINTIDTLQALEDLNNSSGTSATIRSGDYFVVEGDTDANRGLYLVVTTDNTNPPSAGTTVKKIAGLDIPSTDVRFSGTPEGLNHVDSGETVSAVLNYTDPSTGQLFTIILPSNTISVNVGDAISVTSGGASYTVQRLQTTSGATELFVSGHLASVFTSGSSIFVSTDGHAQNTIWTLPTAGASAYTQNDNFVNDTTNHISELSAQVQRNTNTVNAFKADLVSISAYYPQDNYLSGDGAGSLDFPEIQTYLHGVAGYAQSGAVRIYTSGDFEVISFINIEGVNNAPKQAEVDKFEEQFGTEDHISTAITSAAYDSAGFPHVLNFVLETAYDNGHGVGLKAEFLQGTYQGRCEVRFSGSLTPSQMTDTSFISDAASSTITYDNYVSYHFDPDHDIWSNFRIADPESKFLITEGVTYLHDLTELPTGAFPAKTADGLEGGTLVTAVALGTHIGEVVVTTNTNGTESTATIGVDHIVFSDDSADWDGLGTPSNIFGMDGQLALSNESSAAYIKRNGTWTSYIFPSSTIATTFGNIIAVIDQSITGNTFQTVMRSNQNNTNIALIGNGTGNVLLRDVSEIVGDNTTATGISSIGGVSAGLSLTNTTSIQSTSSGSIDVEGVAIQNGAVSSVSSLAGVTGGMPVSNVSTINSIQFDAITYTAMLVGVGSTGITTTATGYDTDGLSYSHNGTTYYRLFLTDGTGEILTTSQNNVNAGDIVYTKTY